jgi:hypothetical protein
LCANKQRVVGMILTTWRHRGHDLFHIRMHFGCTLWPHDNTG